MELFDLCKQVYETTGWETEDRYVVTLGGKTAIWGWRDAQEFDKSERFPIFTSDYLLEKLPEEVNKKILVITNGDRPHAGYTERDNYGNYTLDEKFYRDACYSNEVRKALLKLTLSLNKAGVEL